MLLHLDVIRGEHSTGLLAVEKDFATTIVKSLGTPGNLYAEHADKFENGVWKGSPLLLMGHNRFATQGGISIDTAHPFEFENVIGCHNGTVRPFSIKTLYEADKYEVDSQIIFSEISESGSADKVWEEADGAMALTWWDKERNELNFARNNQRSFYTCFINGGKTMFWASEGWMLEIALGRQNLKHTDIKPSKLDVNICYRWNADKGVTSVTYDLPLPKPVPAVWYNNNYPPRNKVVRKVKVEDFVPFTGGKKWEGTFFGTLDDGQDVTLRTTGLNSEKLYNELMANGKAGKPYYFFDEMYMFGQPGNKSLHAQNLYGANDGKVAPIIGFNNQRITMDTFKKVADFGCTGCLGFVTLSDVHNVKWISDHEVVCKTCQEDPFVQRFLEM